MSTTKSDWPDWVEGDPDWVSNDEEETTVATQKKLDNFFKIYVRPYNYVWHVNLERVREIEFAFRLVYLALLSMFGSLIKPSRLWNMGISPVAHNPAWHCIHTVWLCWLVDRNLTCWPNVDLLITYWLIGHMLTYWLDLYSGNQVCVSRLSLW